MIRKIIKVIPNGIPIGILQFTNNENMHIQEIISIEMAKNQERESQLVLDALKETKIRAKWLKPDSLIYKSAVRALPSITVKYLIMK